MIKQEVKDKRVYKLLQRGEDDTDTPADMSRSTVLKYSTLNVTVLKTVLKHSALDVTVLKHSTLYLYNDLIKQDTIQ